jgi:hypothetical protein
MYACTGAVTCFATSGASHFWGCLFVFAHATTIYFGSDSKEIAHRYRLKRIGNPSQFVLLAPYDTGGLIIEEIGWPKPFILARAFGSQYWDRIDSDHAEHIRISDAERRLDQRYRSIPVENAEAAWNHLKRPKRMW